MTCHSQIKNGETSTSGALVLQTNAPYRTIAQANWGLTKEEMNGMHVHHRIPQSKGGSNDPTNLFVCSPWFHAYVWHAENTQNSMVTLRASAGGRAGKGVSRNKGRKFGPMPLEGKLKRSQTLTGRKAPQAPITCPHCGVSGRPGPMALHHFDRCRHA